MILGYCWPERREPEDVKIIGAGGNTMPLALEKDSVHAGMMLDPFFTAFLKAGQGLCGWGHVHHQGHAGAMGGDVQGTTLLTRPGRDRQASRRVQKMVTALVKANKLIASSSGDAMAALLPKELAGDPKLYAESVRAREGRLPPDSLVSKEGVARVIETDARVRRGAADVKLEPESVYGQPLRAEGARPLDHPLAEDVEMAGGPPARRPAALERGRQLPGISRRARRSRRRSWPSPRSGGEGVSSLSGKRPRVLATPAGWTASAPNFTAFHCWLLKTTVRMGSAWGSLHEEAGQRLAEEVGAVADGGDDGSTPGARAFTPSAAPGRSRARSSAASRSSCRGA